MLIVLKMAALLVLFEASLVLSCLLSLIGLHRDLGKLPNSLIGMVLIVAIAALIAISVAEPCALSMILRRSVASSLMLS